MLVNKFELAESVMNRQSYKTTRKGQPKHVGPRSKCKIQMLAKPKASSSTSTPKLREIYFTKTEWAIKTMPKLKEK
jgi:hypothetical protein